MTKALADHMESPWVGMAQQRCSDLRKEAFLLQSLPIIECKLTQKRDTNLDKAISFSRGQFSERNLSVSYQEPSHFRNWRIKCFDLKGKSGRPPQHPRICKLPNHSCYKNDLQWATEFSKRKWDFNFNLWIILLFHCHFGGLKTFQTLELLPLAAVAE